MCLANSSQAPALGCRTRPSGGRRKRAHVASGTAAAREYQEPGRARARPVCSRTSRRDLAAMLEMRGVTKRYGAITAVRNVSFTVRPGEVLGYLGPNGSGKSTTVRMLAGLMPPSSGTILFDGADIQQNLAAYKAEVGYVPEEATVYTYLTAPEHLRLCGRLRGLRPGPLEQKIDSFLRILGLDTDRHAALSAFSKGMRQKVLLAAALLHNPR